MFVCVRATLILAANEGQISVCHTVNGGGAGVERGRREGSEVEENGEGEGRCEGTEKGKRKEGEENVGGIDEGGVC